MEPSVLQRVFQEMPIIEWECVRSSVVDENPLASLALPLLVWVCVKSSVWVCVKSLVVHENALVSLDLPLLVNMFYFV